MQLQIECNNLLRSRELCCLCEQSFECKEARVIVCNDQGLGCGNACPECISQGFSWVKTQFEQLDRFQKTVLNYQRKPQEIVIGALRSVLQIESQPDTRNLSSLLDD